MSSALSSVVNAGSNAVKTATNFAHNHPYLTVAALTASIALTGGLGVSGAAVAANATACEIALVPAAAVANTTLVAAASTAVATAIPLSATCTICQAGVVTAGALGAAAAMSNANITKPVVKDPSQFGSYSAYQESECNAFGKYSGSPATVAGNTTTDFCPTEADERPDLSDQETECPAVCDPSDKVNATATPPEVEQCMPEDKPRKVKVEAGWMSKTTKNVSKWVAQKSGWNWVKSTRPYQWISTDERSGWNWAGRIAAGYLTIAGSLKLYEHYEKPLESF